ncbi:MAG: aldo/keto reductase [Rhodospirillaceae bacterium]|nr:aldo/keto reductase [Rhodospirillaceae bacterium]
MLPTIEIARGVRIPRMIRGTWQLHEAARTLDRAAAVADLVAGCEAGFTAIEAADTYDGVEDLLGAVRAALAGRIAFRVHTRVSQLGTAPLKPAAVRAKVDRARRRLGQERLDLVQLQWWNLDLPGWVEAAQTLADLRRDGAVAEIGVTNFPASAMVVLLDAGVPLITNQVQMSLLDPRAAHTLAPAARERGVKLLGYGPLAGGFLSEAWLGKPAPGLQPVGDERFGTVYRRLIDRFGGWDWFQALLRALAACARRRGADIAAVAIAWMLRRGDAAALLVGLSGAKRIPGYARAANLVLAPQDAAAIEAVLAQRPPVIGDIADWERGQMMAEIAASYAAAP